MNLDFTNRTALVGGSSQGLGAAVAKELALNGASVVLMARNEEKLKAVMASLDRNRQQRHTYMCADTTRPGEVKEKVDRYLASGRQIEIFISNTGGPASGPLISTPAAALKTAFDAHLITSHLIVQSLFEGMKKAGYGRIVNILSTSVKEPINALGISNTVRAAMANWAKTLAGEIAQYGITVNNVLPGYTKTSRLDYLFGKQAGEAGTTAEIIEEKNAALVPVRRLGEPEELAAAVAFLCSPAAANINGINLPVDGGKLASL